MKHYLLCDEDFDTLEQTASRMKDTNLKIRKIQLRGRFLNVKLVAVLLDIFDMAPLVPY